jgi:hypothetical protein
MRFFLADSRFPWRSVRRCSLLLFALLLIPLAASAQDSPSGFFPGAINVFAGNGSGTGTSVATYPIDGTSPTQNGIGGTPKAMAVDSMGDVFLADNSYVWMVPSNAGATKVPPILAAVTTKACTPVNPVAGDIYQVTGYLVLSGGCGSTGPHEFAPYVNISAIWFDANDNLYVADAGQSWSTSTGYDVSEMIQDTTSGAVTVKIIAGIAGKETYFSSNSDVNGKSPTSIGIGMVSDVKTDSYGNIYIVDGIDNSVVYVIYAETATAPPPVLAAENYTPVKGDIYVIAGIAGNYCGPSPSSPCDQAALANSILLSEPGFVFVDAVGNVYITDLYENILDIIYVGEVNGAVPPVLVNAGYSNPHKGYLYVVAGKYSATALTACATKPCGDGGLATAATFNNPENVNVDSAGNVYIADYKDNAIRKIDTSGYVSTIAGIDDPSGIQVAPSSAGAGGAATSAKLYEPSTIAFDSTGSNLYIGDSNIVVWQVEPAQAQTITFPALESSATYGDKVALGATASSGLDVSYTVSPTASGSVSGTGSNAKLTVTAGSGSITVTASQGTAAGGSTAVTSATGTVSYYAPTTAAEDVTQTITTINPALLTVTANPVSLLPSQLAAFVLSPTDTAAITLANGNLANTAAYSGAPDFQTTATASASCGTPYSITPSKGSLTSTNYDFTNFVSGTVTITGTATQTINLSSTLPSAVTYGKITSVPLSATTGSGGTVTWSLLSGPSGTTINGSTLNIGGAGTIKVQAIQNGTCTYAASPTVTYTLTVSPAPLTVTAPSPSYPYGTNITTALAATAPTITGWVGSDTSALVSGSPVYTTSATSTSDPNSFTLSVAQGYLAVASNAAANYTLVAPTATYTSGTITITKASQTIGYFAPTSITYGGYPTVTASANSNTTSASSGLAVTATATGALTVQGYSGSTFNFNASGTGAGTITLTQAGNTDYAAATPVVLPFTVAQAPLYITANSYTREQGAANPTFTYYIGTATVGATGGFQNGDTDIPSVLSGVPVLTTTATQASPGSAAGIAYPITVDVSAMTSTNYTLVPKNGTLTVGPAGTYAITANPSSLTIQRGLSAQSTITITPSNDYQGTITLTCGTLPANVTCTVSPSTYTFTGEFVSNGNVVAEQPQKGTITINTTSATVVGSNAQKSNVSLAGFLIPGALAGLFLVFARKRVARIATFWSLCALLALGIGATLGLSSCGGSSVNTTAAAGTQTITITGTGTTPSGSGAVTATVPLTVTIQ